MEQPAERGEAQPALGIEPATHLSWLAWAGFGVALYLLALGPAVKIHRSTPPARPAIQAVYFWVEPLARASPQFKAATQWYLHHVWRVR